MKRLIFVLLFSMVAMSELFSQSANFKTVPAEYSVSTKAPLLFTKGDTIKVFTDSIYLMNAMRYNFYKNIH